MSYIELVSTASLMQVLLGNFNFIFVFYSIGSFVPLPNLSFEMIGFASITYPQGGISYTCEMKNNECDGLGFIHNLISNQRIYMGEIHPFTVSPRSRAKANVRTVGVLFDQNGRPQYEGHMINLLPDGYGVSKLPNGEIKDQGIFRTGDFIKKDESAIKFHRLNQKIRAMKFKLERLFKEFREKYTFYAT